MRRAVRLAPMVWQRRGAPVGIRQASSSSSALFGDAKTAYASKSTLALLRGIMVFRICGIRPLVDRADELITLSNRVFGARLTEFVTKSTFFAHFCGGETEESLAPVIDDLWRFRVGAILDYAAEADLKEEEPEVQTHSAGTTSAVDSEGGGDPTDEGGSPYRLRRTRSFITARSYDYVDEQLCDANVAIFEDCVRAVDNVSPNGFAAIKLTALGNPLLLERVATMMAESQRLFERMDRKNSGRLTRSEFRAACANYFEVDDAEADELFDKVKSQAVGEEEEQIDIVEWISTIDPERISKLVERCRDRGPLFRAALTDEELRLMGDMYGRVDQVATLARGLGVRLMVDAEQTYFQPAIDAIVLRLQRHHNVERPTIFNTYQCYLVDAKQRAAQDVERSRREGWRFGAKLVRGAYLVTERARAEERGYPSPVHATLEDTHQSYNDTIALVLDEVESHGANLMVASHNQRSCELVLERVGAWKDPSLADGVFFAQLLGMADHMTFTLGHLGYKAFKYVPYGPCNEVMPYLIRRAQENSDVMGAAAEERAMMWREVKRRVLGR